jgi:GNAT superfamily N-acetyltransferase
MRAHLPQALKHGLLLGLREEGSLVAALSSTPPGAYPLPVPRLVPRLRCLLGQGLTVAQRWARVFEQLRDHHPVQDHWYLGTIGVDPTMWGRGLGSELLAAWLRRVDAEHMPAYLETDLEQNLRFYRRVGFDVCEEVRVLGVTIWTMQRLAVRGG